MKYPTLPKACARYGAQMGRRDSIMEPDAEIRFRLYMMPMYDGDYDSGGAYWGAGNPVSGWMYHAYGDGPEYRNEMFLRACDWDEAKDKVRLAFPNAKFYR